MRPVGERLPQAQVPGEVESRPGETGDCCGHIPCQSSRHPLEDHRQENGLNAGDQQDLHEEQRYNQHEVEGWRAGAGAPPLYFVLVVPLLFMQVLLVTCIQTVLMSVVLQWVPARLARDVAAAVAGLTGAGLYLC